MKARFRILIGVAILVLAVGTGTWLYVFRKDTTDMVRAKTDFRIGAADLYREFESGEQPATEKYGSKVLEINGQVISIEKNEWGNVTVTFVDPMFGVTCTIDSLQAIGQAGLIGEINAGDSATLKGRCDGMLTDVKIVKCVIVK
ncbi:MAG: hypothetical protein A2X22_12890 [Bacteroidetes bacterium GWF2_49_14]|nr:MAG: hypothetical protein A2X22_12890 [Bacteroidetes bacterium GWF2_49_14]HBB92258.1 hypothetical protein [Bacteroidales bacterium]